MHKQEKQGQDNEMGSLSDGPISEPLRILILEDVPTDVELVKRELQKTGIMFTSKWVDNRDAFLNELEDFSPDIVLSDYSMPTFSGTEALELVKERYPSIPLIIVTGSMNEETAVLCLNSGAADYIIKENMVRLGPAVIEAVRKTRIKEERERATKALEESEERYRTLFQSVPEGILIVDIETQKMDFVNPAFCEMLGYSEEEVIQSKLIDFLPKEHLDRVFPEFKSQVHGEKTSVQDIPCLPKDGKKIYADISIAPILIDGRKYSLAFFRDITERKKLEARFAQAQKMEAIGTLAGGIAHDFNNLLTAIIGNSELASIHNDKDTRLNEYIEEIRSAANSAAMLTRQLLAFSRKQVIQPKALDLNKKAVRMEKMIRRLIGEDIEFKTKLAPDLWKVYADPGQIEQVMMNLVVNSRDAMPLGGKITIETANVRLDRDHFNDRGVSPQTGDYAMLSVSDNGVGMDAEVQSRIFEPFFTTKERGSGTGLGLSTVYGIVKQSNGYIWAFSEPGKGTIFKIYFPRMKEEGAPEEIEQTQVEDLDGWETILIVEDDERLRFLTKKILLKHGYKILEFESGGEALEAIGAYEGPVHLLITDVVMPGMSGKETAENIQALYPDIRVLFMSGYLDDTIARHGILSPDVNFLEKPFSPKNLAGIVRKILDQGD